MPKKINFKSLKKLEKKDEDKLYAALLERCVPVAREITKLVAEHADKYQFGDAAQTSDSSHTLAEEVIALMVERNIRWNDRAFIIQLALQPLDGVRAILDDAFEKSWTRVVTGIIGKKASDLTIGEVDAYLQKGTKIDEAIVSEAK